MIYIASLNGYNLKIEEDNTQNRLIESINLFYILASSSYFANTPFILFLNKTDLFRYLCMYMLSHYVEVAQGAVSIVEQYTIDCEYLAYFLPKKEKKEKL